MGQRALSRGAGEILHVTPVVHRGRGLGLSCRELPLPRPRVCSDWNKCPFKSSAIPIFMLRTGGRRGACQLGELWLLNKIFRQEPSGS